MARVKVEMQVLVTFEIDVDFSDASDSDEEHDLVEQEASLEFETLSSSWGVDVDEFHIDHWVKK